MNKKNKKNKKKEYYMIIPKNKQSKRQNETRSEFRTSGAVLGPILLSIGLMLLAFSCAPAGIGGELAAPGAVIDLNIDEASIDSTSFMVRWAVPTETVIKPDGTALSPDEIVYRVYYLAETTGQAAPSAESIKQNPDTKTQDVPGIPYARLVNLEPGTRYFITIDSGYTDSRDSSEAAGVLGLGSTSWRLGRATSRAVATGRSGESGLSFDGYLSYAQREYRYLSGFSIQTIEPTENPTASSSPFSGESVPITYSFEKIGDASFDPLSAIDGYSGVVTIYSTTNVGVASYHIRAEAEGYNTQTKTLIIIINEGLPVTAYYDGTTTRIAPVKLGQAIEDRSTFSLENNAVVLAVSNLTDGMYEIYFGSEEGNYNSGSYSKETNNGTLEILKSELIAPTHTFPFVDGAVIGISGPGITRTQHVATYFPSNIYSSQDLQAMRVDLDRDYILQNNIEFPNRGTRNYTTVGRFSDTPFTGSLDGKGYVITGVHINSLSSNQGLFGVIEGETVDTMVVQDLVLRGFSVKGSAAVGSLAGWIKEGTVDNVRVEVSDAGVGNVELGSTNTYGGGLVGLTGTDSLRTGIVRAGVLVKIKNTSSEALIFAPTGLHSLRMGGLVGYMDRNVVLTKSYATGDVIGTGNTGGLVGYSSYGTVSGGSYATGDVTGTGHTGGLIGYNGFGTVSGGSYATGDVTGTGNTGGLIGLNISSTVSGYATGDVTGSNDSVGGLVGSILGGTVSGYATGVVKGNRRYVGGLVGHSYNGTVSGYATGSVTGDTNVGGLVGWNEESETGNSVGSVSGYAIGTVLGTSATGGLVGVNSGVVSGYARNIVRRRDGTSLSFGKTVGINTGRTTTYNSADNIISESRVYAGSTGTVELTGTTGVSGISVLVDDRITESAFERLSFGASLGQWTWVSNDGLWPGINVGNNVKPVEEQPLDSCFSSDSLEQCLIVQNLQASTYHSGYRSLPVELGQAIADDESGAFALADDAVVLVIRGLSDGNYTVHFGPSTDDYSGTIYQRTASNGIIEILKSELTASAGTFGNGFVIGMSGQSLPSTYHVATYVPSNIYNHEDLQAIRNDRDRDYVLMQDIVFSSVDAGASNYKKIGSSDAPFTGSLDGKNHSITGVQIEDTAAATQGLFGSMEAATVDEVVVQNLVLRDFKISGGNNVGSLAGQLKKGRVNNVHVEVSASGAGYVKGNNNFVGGLIGYSAGKVKNSGVTTGLVKGASNVGGLLGSNDGGTVADSYAIGDVIGTGSSIGGLQGSNNGGTVSNSYATGDVTGDQTTGGLLGSNNGGTASNSYATGDVTGDQTTGGLVGYNTGTVSSSYATGDVTGDQLIGGLAGSNNSGTVTGDSYATGNVTGTGNSIGGLLGSSNDGSVFGYATGDVTGKFYTGGLVGLSSSTVTGYATGSVTGDFYTGGLVGHSNGAVTGYAIRSVTGTDFVGGLVGFNDNSTVVGYVLGVVTGNDFVGGLVGDSNSGTVTGYAIGSVIGSDYTGGLVGGNAGTVSGYARSIVRRADRRATTFGKTIGEDTGTSTTYSSSIESRVYNGPTGTTLLVGRGEGTSDGTEVTVDARTTRAAFSGLVFGADVGQWTWVANGMWAAINIGDEIKPANEQQLESCLISGSSELCQLESELQTSTYYRTVTSSLPLELGQAIVDDSTTGFALANDAVIFTISNLINGTYFIRLGLEKDNYAPVSGSKLVSDGSLEILKSDLVNSFFSVTDGVVVGLSGPSFTSTQHVATYHQSNIYNHYDLQAIRKDLTQDYVLKNDIEFPSGDAGTGTIVNNYEAIGDNDNPFTGSLDGAGYTISGIQIESPSDDYQGLFGAIEASEVDAVIVQNFVLSDFKIKGKNNVGSLAGRLKRGTMSDVHVEVSTSGAGYVIGLGDKVGGFVGSNDEEGTVTAHVVGDVTGTGHSVGGLVGWNEGTVTDSSYSVGLVTGNSYSVGGLVGTNANAGTVSGYVTGDVTGTDNNVGGLVGNNRNAGGTVTGHATGNVTGVDRAGGLVGNSTGTMSGYMTGSVTGEDYTGGVVGYSSGTVTESHMTGSVEGNANVGGLAGYNDGTVTDSYAIGPVTGTDKVGGLVGHIDDDGMVTESYATGPVTGASLVGGFVGSSRGTATGYATGDVTGTSSNVGGFAGYSVGIATGYATGDVTGAGSVGGFVGYSVGFVSGYATGSVEGNANVGGLVGHNHYIMTGYATGSVTGTDKVGGLVGRNNNDGVVAGYARGVVRRANGSSAVTFGKTIGLNLGSHRTFSSSNSLVPESKLYRGTSGTIALTGTTGIDGTAVNAANPITENLFVGFNFSVLRIGRWISVAGKWPGIYIGDFKPANEQPVDL